MKEKALSNKVVPFLLEVIMAYIEKLIFNKETSKVYCVNTDGEEYANFPVSFNFWGGYNSEGEARAPIPNGTYPISMDDMEYGHYQGGAYGMFWIGLDSGRGRGFHGYGENRTLTSGTYGCVRGENDDGMQICRAVEEALNAGVCVIAEVVGDVDESQFCVGYDGRQ